MKTVLIVDDSRSILATSELALEPLVEAGLLELRTYLDPLKLYQDLLNGSVSYDLLISDVNMPQMNGLDLAEKIKQLEKFRQKPLLIFTTENSAPMKARGREIGVTGWMVKPLSDDKLVKAIRMVLGI